jgi:hypothetical protein
MGWGIHSQLMGSKAIALHVTVYLLDSLPNIDRHFLPHALVFVQTTVP